MLAFTQTLNHIMFNKALKQHVANRGVPPDDFLAQLIDWGKTAPNDIFEPNPFSDIYTSVKNTLGPYRQDPHRRAVMLEVLRVLAGFESSWNFNEGKDPANHNPDPRSFEAGAWQVSADSMSFGSELRDLVLAHGGAVDPDSFQRLMKHNHPVAMEYIARLLRRTTSANGPVVRHEIDPFLRTDAVDAFLQELN